MKETTKEVVVGESELKKDLEIALYILEMRYLSMDQVIRKFYENGKVEERLGRLFDRKIIESKDKDVKLNSLIRVSVSGVEELKRVFTEQKLPERERNIFQPRVNHDLLLNDLRIRFEELGFVNKWVSEARLKEVPMMLRSFKDLPDALCKKKNDKSYFLELEVSPKSASVYRSRVQEYLEKLEIQEFKDAGIEGVIFFCTKEEVVETLKKQIPKGVKNVSVQLYAKYFPVKKEVKDAPKIH